MATLYSLDIATGDYNQPMVSGAKRESLVDLIYFLKRCLAGGNTSATTISVRNTGVKATGTVTCASIADSDTVTINGVAFTAQDASPGANEFLQTGDDTADAAALAAAINASASAGISGIVTATSSGAVVTVSAAVPGKIGNAITLASSNGTRAAVSAARLAGGSESAFTFSL